MKISLLLLMAVFIAGVSAETVSKNSAAFQFPTTVGVKGYASMLSNDISFSYKVRSGNRAVIGLSWSLPDKTQRGTISIFNLAGTRVKTFLMAEQQGEVSWDLSTGRRLANGVYLATMMSGSYKKNLQILISR